MLKGGQIELGNSGMITGAFSSTSGKADTVLTTNGDVLYYNSGRQRLAIGSEGKVLTVSDADLPAWETVSAGATTAVQRVVLGSTFNTDSTSLVDVTGMTVTLPDNSGHSFISFIMCMEMNDGTGLIGLRLVDGSTNLNGITMTAQTAEQLEVLTYPYCVANDGQVIKLQAKVNANDVDIIAGAMQSSEISVLNVS